MRVPEWATRASFIAIAATLRLSSGAPTPASYVEHSEDLTIAKVPNGIVQLPVRGSPAAGRAGGYIFRFKDASLQSSPLDGQGNGRPDFKAIRAAILNRKTGDLCYSPQPDESFLAWSGRIVGLGCGFLFELSGRELPAPPAARGEQEPEGKTGVQYPGRLDDVRLDGRYLVETIEGRFALLRVLEKAPTFVVFQWVYEPSGSRVFQIPKRQLLGYEPMASAAERIGLNPALPRAPTPAGGPTPRAPEGERVEEFPKGEIKHLADREVLIKRLMEILENKNDTASSLARGLAAEVLGRMRASEAAPLLASLIDASLPYSGPVGKEAVRPPIGNIYGAVPALVGIGKPGAVACLNALCKLAAPEWDKTSKPRLLCTVLLRVEGKSGAKLLLQERMNGIEDERAVENLRRSLQLIEQMRVGFESSSGSHDFSACGFLRIG